MTSTARATARATCPDCLDRVESAAPLDDDGAITDAACTRTLLDDTTPPCDDHTAPMTLRERYEHTVVVEWIAGHYGTPADRTEALAASNAAFAAVQADEGRKSADAWRVDRARALDLLAGIIGVR